MFELDQRIAEQLTEDGLEATAYHAGMKPEQREQIQQDFITSSDGIVVATIAFGIGIDKSDCLLYTSDAADE